MQYVRSISSGVSKTWNSINPATLSGAIDVIVVEQEDGSLACSPFHIRFGKFSLLRPSEKKVEFRINGEKQEFPMKLGEGGEAFFVFETKESIPEALQTSPLVSPATSPGLEPSSATIPALQEPEPFHLESGEQDFPLGGERRGHSRSTTEGMPIITKAQSERGDLASFSNPSKDPLKRRPSAGGKSHLVPNLHRMATDGDLPATKAAISRSFDQSEPLPTADRPPLHLRARTDRSTSPPPWTQEEAVSRAINLSKKLWTSNIATQVSDSGDLMLDMTGYKSDASEALQAEGIARKLLSEELEGPYDIGSLIGADEKGNLWIYSSEEAKEAAGRKAAAAVEGFGTLGGAFTSTDALSDPGYHSDDARSDGTADYRGSHIRRDSDSAIGLNSQPPSPGADIAAGDPNRNYAKTLRLTSDQLKTMNLQMGGNSMSFSVNRATCTATLWYWKHDVPIVISDIDGTITKSDVLGHVLTRVGRDWTHLGVAKLYTEISNNGYNFIYLTSRSVGQADNTRAYLDGVVQDGYRLPKGPTILSPDRTIAALRREIYLRKPEIFKMACLRDIMALFAGHGGASDTHASAEIGLHTVPTMSNPIGSGRGRGGSPFYAGFGNRLTDALSYRSVNIPSTRIFTINSNSEVSLDLLSLNKYKTGYASMREIVDHYFPPVGLRLLTEGGAEDFTDFNYWRDNPLDVVDFTDSEDEDDDVAVAARGSLLDRTQTRTTMESRGTDGGMSNSLLLSEDEAGDDMLDSYLSEPRLSIEDSLAESYLDEEGEGDEYELSEELSRSLLEAGDDADEEDITTPEPDVERRLVTDDLTNTPRSKKPRREMLDESDVESV